MDTTTQKEYISCVVTVLSTKYEKHFVKINSDTTQLLVDYNVDIKIRPNLKNENELINTVSCAQGKYHHLLKQNIDWKQIKTGTKYNVYLKPYNWSYDGKNGVSCAIYYDSLYVVEF
jgi:murein tripeptide amidase MpaA